MNESRARELFLDYHRGSLAPADASTMRALLAAQPGLQREFDEFTRTLEALDAMPTPKPSPHLRANVFAAIEAEKRAVRKNISVPPRPAAPAQRPRWFWLGQAAAAVALVAAGFVAGTRHSGDSNSAVASTANSSTQQQIADLRRQVDSLQNFVSNSLVKEQRPTNDRLRAVLASATVETPSNRVIEELLGSLALDASTNVRLMALQALYPHANLEAVRSGVLGSLAREQNPLMQIAMIDFLVAARDREAVTTIEKISRNETTDLTVRDAAVRALNQL